MKLRPSHVAFLLSLALLLAVTAVGAGAWRALDTQQNERLRQARFQFSVGDVRDALNASLQLGVSLQNLPNAQLQLDAAFKQHADALSMDVADATGQIVFSTDGSGVGARVPSAWVAQCVSLAQANDATSAQVFGESADAQWRCAPLLDGIGQAAGVLVLRYGADKAGAVNDGGVKGGGVKGAALKAQTIALGASDADGPLSHISNWLALSAALALLGAAWISRGYRFADAALAQAQGEAPSGTQIDTSSANAGNPMTPAHPGLIALQSLHEQLAQAEAQIDAMDGAEVG